MLGIPIVFSTDSLWTVVGRAVAVCLSDLGNRPRDPRGITGVVRRSDACLSGLFRQACWIDRHAPVTITVKAATLPFYG
jgi:hypothetical protein